MLAVAATGLALLLQGTEAVPGTGTDMVHLGGYPQGPPSGESNLAVRNLIQEGDDDAAGQFFFCLFCFEFCLTAGDFKYETVSVGLLGLLWYLITGHHLGSCSDEATCNNLCSSDGGDLQGQVSDDGHSCFCILPFLSAAFVPGGLQSTDDTVEELNGRSYRVFSNFTTVETGILNLAKAVSMIEGVTCSSEGGTVKIRFYKKIEPSQLGIMFPNGTILAVDGAILGSCLLGNGEMDFYASQRFPDATEDGYLTIETSEIVGDSNYEVLVSGSPTSFFFMFEESDQTADARDIDVTVDHTFNIENRFPEDTSAGIQLFAGVAIDLYLFLGLGAKCSWKRGCELSATFGYEVTVSPRVGVEIFKGTSDYNEVFEDLLCVPIEGIPKIKALDFLKITQPKLGFYFEVDWFLESIFTTDVGAILSVNARASKVVAGVD